MPTPIVSVRARTFFDVEISFNVAAAGRASMGESAAALRTFRDASFAVLLQNLIIANVFNNSKILKLFISRVAREAFDREFANQVRRTLIPAIKRATPVNTGRLRASVRIGAPTLLEEASIEGAFYGAYLRPETHRMIAQRIFNDLRPSMQRAAEQAAIKALTG
ncbi:MAG: hypothetical protein F4118_10610 [Acidimicrobiaceae bacterium]|nr:hypothetical protein [Candidatus Poribacteria bacterium]MYI36861.1 hypothetical protein [Acidimicrobiaceae bacterium]